MNNNSTHPRYKTRLCRHWLRGYCKLQENCGFKHGWYDKKAPKNSVKLTRTNSMSSVNIKWGNEPLPRNASSMSENSIIQYDDAIPPPLVDDSTFFLFSPAEILLGREYPENKWSGIESEFEFINNCPLNTTE